MNILTNIHRASTIEIERKSYGSNTWTSIAIRAQDGSYYELALHDADPKSPVKITGVVDADWQSQAVKTIDRMRAWIHDSMVCECEHGHVCYECEMLEAAKDLLRSARPIETPK